MSARLVSVFVLVACAAATAAAAASGSGAGISGRVVAGPSCPVESVPSEARCAPRPVAARVRVYRRADRHTVARLRTDGDGRFHVRLRPGRYAVSARPVAGGPLPSCPQDLKTTVRAGAYTRVIVSCDSGIR